VSLAVVTGCVFQAPVIPPTGAVYMSAKAPLDIDVAATDLGTKDGQATSHSVLFLVAWGDASVGAAARAGGLKKIKHVDYDYFNILGVYQEFTTIAYGD
jgi:hypothetical protein